MQEETTRGSDATTSPRMTKKNLDGGDFLSVLHGAISTLKSLKTDEKNYGYMEDEFSHDSVVILPNLQFSPRGKKSSEDTKQVTPRTRRRHSLMAPVSSRTTLLSSATSVTVEAESPRTQFWNNPAPPSQKHLQFSSQSAVQDTNAVSLPQIRSTYSGSVVSDAKTCFNLPRMNNKSRSKTVCEFPLNKTRRSKSLMQSVESMSDIRTIQMRRISRVQFGLPRHSEARSKKRKTLWKTKIFERKQPF